MKQFAPPLKVGDLVLYQDTLMVVRWISLCENWATAQVEGETSTRILHPDTEGSTWKRYVRPLAVGDEVIIIERRTGVVKSIHGNKALLGSGPDGEDIIDLDAEGREWERKKE